MNGDADDRISPPDHSRPLREDPDRVSLEDHHLAYHHHHHHVHPSHHHVHSNNSNNNSYNSNINNNNSSTNLPQMRITSDNIADHMTDSSRLSRLSPERTSIFEDRLSPEHELAPRLSSSSRHVSPARGSPSPEPRSPSHTPAPTALSSTPPPTVPPSSFASASTRATSTAGTSEASFEVLSGYDPISPAERHRQWQREIYSNNAAAAAAAAAAVPAFRPNADLPFPITPQLLRYYPYPSQHQPPKEEFVDRRYSEPRYQEPPMSPQPMRGQAMMYDGRFSHGPPPPQQQQQQRNGSAVPSGLSAPHYRSSSSEVSVGGSSCSGIPSFAREFEGRGWRFDPILTESSHHSPPAPPSSSASTPRKEESIASVYVNEFASQLDLLLRYAKRPFVALMIVGFFGLLLSTLVQNFSAATPDPWGAGDSGAPGAWNSSFAAATTRASYADFPTLMNIESSFEKIVDSAAGGSALARVMKQSEMAVSDLSTVVRYSDLKCKETLAERLDVFARDAKGNVRALQGFGSKVGGVLDQLLSINQYALRELTMIQRESAHRPFLARLLTPTSFFRSPSHYSREPSDPRTRARVAETFNKAAEVLESNLRLLVADGETIFASLTQLTEQHKPIYDEIVREVVDIKKEEAVVLASLWTKVGGNAAQRKNFRENAELLALIGSYEEQARGYVESTVLELDRMTADLENLRRRVAEPLLVPEAGAGAGGASRRGREEAAGIPLGVHVEAIETAVERLLRKRRQRREKEGNWMKRLHDGEAERARKEDIVVEGAGAA